MSDPLCRNIPFDPSTLTLIKDTAVVTDASTVYFIPWEGEEYKYEVEVDDCFITCVNYLEFDNETYFVFLGLSSG